MVQYVVRVQVIELARREGIAEIETVREIPEVVILSIDGNFTTSNIGTAVSAAQKLVKQMNKES
jgi:hypothetical protein